MRIATRLLVLVGGLSAAMLCMGLVGLVGLVRANASLQSVYEYRTTPAVQLGRIDALLTANRMHVAEALANPTPEVIASSVQSVQANQADINALWLRLDALPRDPDESQMAAAFVQDRQAFDTQGLAPALQALRDNDITEAQSAMVHKMTPLAVPLKKTIDALKQHQIDAARQEYEAAYARFHWIRAAFLAAMVLGAALALGLGLRMLRAIVGQLGGEPTEATAIAERVGGGDLAVPVRVRAHDQHSLMAQLHAMQTRLSAVVQQVRHAAESVANASAEIAQGNQHLSQRTEAQSGALQQTASSMEDLGQAVHGNAQRASQAYQLAQDATQVALRCGESVAQVVQTMTGINQSSQHIAEIIGVIDGIAFQTNILALNAAVEAARAGDQGRGFAVVASEVRSLAGRSAQAAKEIKALIGNSVERVSHGNVQVNTAQVSMTEVVSAIERLRAIMGEISTASTAQSEGVQQVSRAVQVMDQGTQQNAALVEEMAAAADGLRRQSDELLACVLQFKLPLPQGALPGLRAAPAIAR